jgi:hypothetical protein
MLLKSSENMLAPFGVWTETPMSAGEGGAQGFITAAGGFLQSLLFGYGGLRLHRNSATMRPSLPLHVTTVRCALGRRFCCHGVLLSSDAPPLPLPIGSDRGRVERNGRRYPADSPTRRWYCRSIALARGALKFG